MEIVSSQIDSTQIEQKSKNPQFEMASSLTVRNNDDPYLKNRFCTTTDDAWFSAGTAIELHILQM